MAYTAGKDGAVKVSSQFLCVTDWNCEISTDILDTTNTCSSGYQENIPGVTQIKGGCTADYDPALNPFITPRLLVPGLTAAFTFYPGGTGASPLLVTARIATVNIKQTIRGKISYDITFESTGAFTLPS